MSDRYDPLGPELLISTDGPIRILTMNRPDRLNSFDDALHLAMLDVWQLLDDDPAVGAVVVTGAGRAFSTGGDVDVFVRDADDYPMRRRDLRLAERLVRAMIDTEVPVVAAVQGPAIGLGCTIALLCDLVVMSDATYLADPHVSIGLVAGDGGAVAWPVHTGLLRAKEHLLLGDRIPAAECLRVGLANRVVAADEVLPEALRLAHRLAAQPRQAVRDTKRTLNMHLRAAADGVLAFGLAAEMESFDTDDPRRGAEQFRAARPDSPPAPS